MKFRIIVTALFFVGIGAAFGRADDWPQWMGPNRDGHWKEKGILEKFPEDGPKILWRAKIAGGYAGPAVADGRVYVFDYLTDGDPRKVSTPVGRGKLKGKERIHCLNAQTGKPIWKQEYDCPYNVSYPAGPRCTPTVSGGKVYTLGAMGDLYCWDAVKGTKIWSKDLKKDYKAVTPLWGFCGHPLVEGDKLICVVGGKGSVAVAFNKDTGKEQWKALTAKETGYCPPTLITAGGKKQVLIWHGEAINSLNPQTGDLYWSVPLVPSYGMSIMAPRKLGDYLFAAGIQGAALLLKLDSKKPCAEEVWRGKRDTALYPVNMTPYLEDGTIYGVDAQGPLRGVNLANAKRLWQTFEPTTGKGPMNSGTAFLIKQEDRFFIFNESGHLIIAKLSPKKYEEISRCKLIEPTSSAWNRDVVWSYPAFANKCVFARNDKEIVCASLAK
jgi:outer membrane protein assembly factor BamB